MLIKTAGKEIDVVSSCKLYSYVCCIWETLVSKSESRIFEVKIDC